MPRPEMEDETVGMQADLGDSVQVGDGLQEVRIATSGMSPAGPTPDAKPSTTAFSEPSHSINDSGGRLATGESGPSSTSTGGEMSQGGRDGGGDGGLPTGAVAGIVVGAVMALTLLVGFAWFLLRRAKSKRAASNAGQRTSGDHLEGKDVHSVQLADSPPSTCSADAQPPPQFGGVPAPAPAGDASTSHTPREPDAGDGGGRTPARRCVSRIVAPLVEEGMTEEEIRRLEEEERQLDDEIARARRR